MGFKDHAGDHKTFGLWRAEDLLAKLNWERALLAELEGRSDDNAIFAALNGCATAWHLTEWTWNNLGPATRARLAFSVVRDLEIYVLTRCPALRLCRLIGNGGKHHTLRWNDPEIFSTKRLRVHVETTADGRLIGGRLTGWKLQVVDGNKGTDASELLKTASEYWEAQLAQFRAGPGDHNCR